MAVGERAAASVGREARRQLWLVAVTQVLAMSVWFSTAAVVPSLISAWRISSQEASWLTTAVQLGFVVGSVLSALLNLSDRLPIPRLMAMSAALAGVFNLLVPLLAHGLLGALPLRFFTGLALAGVYPVGVKLMASWFDTGRGLAMGVLVAALTLGSAAPHLVNGVGTLPWRQVLEVTSGLAFLSACVALLLRDGPLLTTGAPLHPAYMRELLRDRAQRLINLGYLGHMWELYALWSWLPAYLAASLAHWHHGPVSSSLVELASFGAIGLGGAAGCVVGGVAAGRVGSAAVAFWAMVASAACCAVSGFVFGIAPWVLVPILVVWGFAVIADSAQFSAALSVAADPRYVGTALTAQMAMGFTITVVTIRLLPLIADGVGWRWALCVLTLGPVAGAWAIRTTFDRRRALGR
jgi:MFS family permease